MNYLQRIVLAILKVLFKDNAGKYHLFTLRVMQKIQRVPFALRLIAFWCEANKNPRPVTICGITFPNPIGLAAGFDKHAQVLLFLQALGFGFIEIGSVLPRWQFGNIGVRLLRIPALQALWNWLGFNSDGAKVIAERLARVRHCIHIPIGGSLGKQLETLLDDAADDYVAVMKAIGRYVNYFAVNISSPNTKDLRRLQGREYLVNLIRRILIERDEQAVSRGIPKQPVFIKISPDLTHDEVATIIDVIRSVGADGVIVGNTTITPPKGFKPTDDFLDENGTPKGGYSGPHLYERMLEMVRFIHKLAPELPIIACGGISSGVDVMRVINAGASLVQVLTGFVYQGPALIRQLRNAS